MARRLRTTSALASAALAASVLLGAAACGGAAPSAPSATAPPGASTPPAVVPSGASSAATPSATTSPVDPAAGFCSEVRANGGNGASFGPIPLFYRRKPLLADVSDKLDAMGDARPPTEIAGAWALQKRTLVRVETAAKKLDDGETPGDDPGVDPRTFHGGKIDKAQDALTDYWFAHCQ